MPSSNKKVVHSSVIESFDLPLGVELQRRSVLPSPTRSQAEGSKPAAEKSASLVSALSRSRKSSFGARKKNNDSSSRKMPSLTLTPNDALSSSVHLDTLLDTMHPVPHPIPPVPVQTQIQRITIRLVGGFREKMRKHNSCLGWASIFLPAMAWLQTYDFRNSLFADAVAGLTVGIMVVPQSMSYAKLAGLPVEYGLYSAFMPVFAYAAFGSSRQLAVGPVALVSLMLSTSLGHIIPDPDENKEVYVQLAIQVSMMVGFTYIVLGALRLGFITIFLSHAVISGFTNGAAVIIGMSQVKYILGAPVERSDVLHEVVENIVHVMDKFNWKTFVFGSSCIFLLLLMKHIGKTYPRYSFIRAVGPLAVTALSIILTVAFKLDKKGIDVVGEIPSGLPEISFSQWNPLGASMVKAGDLISPVLSISIIGFMESIAIAKQLAVKHQYELDSSQELLGLGMANLIGAMFSSYPVTGSFSRTAVNNDTGAKSGISALVTALLVGAVLLFLTPVFSKMPTATLGSIVISGVLGLIDLEEGRFLFKVHKLDFVVWLVSFIGTMFLGVEIGLGIAVGLSLLLVLYESAYPHLPVLGRLPGTNVYRNIKQYPNAILYPGIVICRIDAPIYFANTQNIREKIDKYELAAARNAINMVANEDTPERVEDTENDASFEMLTSLTNIREIRYIVVDMSPVSHIDTAGIHLLEEMWKEYNKRKIQLCLCNPEIFVMEKLWASGLAGKIGVDYIYCNTHDAVKSCLSKMEQRTSSISDQEEKADIERSLSSLKHNESAMEGSVLIANGDGLED